MFRKRRGFPELLIKHQHTIDSAVEASAQCTNWRLNTHKVAVRAWKFVEGFFVQISTLHNKSTPEGAQEARVVDSLKRVRSKCASVSDRCYLKLLLIKYGSIHMLGRDGEWNVSQ
jgi:hypothetical protein